MRPVLCSRRNVGSELAQDVHLDHVAPSQRYQPTVSEAEQNESCIADHPYWPKGDLDPAHTAPPPFPSLLFLPPSPLPWPHASPSSRAELVACSVMLGLSVSGMRLYVNLFPWEQEIAYRTK